MTGIGLTVVFCYTAIGLSLIGALYFLLRRSPWKWVVVVPSLIVVVGLAAAPFIEERRIATQFSELCKGAGVHVFRKVQASGFYDSTMRSGYSYIDRSGYAFMEHPASNDRRKVERLEKAGATWKTVVLEKPTARYHLVESSAGKKPIGHKVWVEEQVLIDTETNEVIARDTKYKRAANTIDQALIGTIGSTLELCPDPSKGPPRAGLPDQAITPIGR